MLFRSQSEKTGLVDVNAFKTRLNELESSLVMMDVKSRSKVPRRAISHNLAKMRKVTQIKRKAIRLNQAMCVLYPWMKSPL